MSTFHDDLEQDLEVFFNEDEFADQVTYKPKVGDQVQTQAIIIYEENQTEDQRGNHTKAEIELKRSDVATPNYGDLIEIDSVDWRFIREVHRDRWVVRLEIRTDTRGHYAKS